LNTGVGQLAVSLLKEFTGGLVSEFSQVTVGSVIVLEFFDTELRFIAAWQSKDRMTAYITE